MTQRSASTLNPTLLCSFSSRGAVVRESSFGVPFSSFIFFFRAWGGRPALGRHIKLVFTTNPLPDQNWGNSLRHSATARLVSRVQGTR